ncbi:hypothetical protein DL767_000904 [Monosporascus sp. MG133]|nr:hypothetical protein DL767_000904 [Monosporascus sp. MG133]
MHNLSQLEEYTNDIATATKHLADQITDAGLSASDSTSSFSKPHLNVPSDRNRELHRARQNVLASLKRFQMFLAEPLDFVQELASQSQLLACLRWLRSFQILPCIPLNDSASLKDVADLAGVPEAQLSRVVRMTATAGFLHEPQPGLIAHTALSASFVTQLSYLDAAMFLAETGAPAALQMAAATKLQGQPGGPNDAVTAYAVAFNTSQTFPVACDQRKKLQRQWLAYFRCSVDVEETVPEILGRLDWIRVGNACVVDVCARSAEAATALAELSPTLHFVVQLGEPPSAISNGAESGRTGTHSQIEQGAFNGLSTRISIQRRAAGSPQTVRDAAVYMFRAALADPGELSPAESRDALILPELWAHLGVLKSNPAATFVLVACLQPDPDSVDPDVEAAARLRNLWKMQLANTHEMEVGELTELISGVHDGVGGLVVVDKRHSRYSSTVAFGIKYQTYTRRQNGAEQ